MAQRNWEHDGLGVGFGHTSAMTVVATSWVRQRARCVLWLWRLEFAVCSTDSCLYHYVVFLQVVLKPDANATPITETLARCASGDHADAVPFPRGLYLARLSENEGQGAAAELFKRPTPAPSPQPYDRLNINLILSTTRGLYILSLCQET